MEMDEDNYGDDFSDNEVPRLDDDEQHTQKVNGQIEALQTKVEELQRELAQEKRSHEESKQLHQQELQAARTASKEENMMASSEDPNSELSKYKSMVSKLKDRLDEALMVGDADACPAILRSEFVKFCKKFKIFPELKEKDVNVAACIQILNSKVVGATPKSRAQSPSNANATAQVANEQLNERIKLLEEELRLALGAAEDIRALKAKLLQMIERTRVEKEQKIRAEIEATQLKRKIEMLTDHMEKLMIHLKHEAAHKARIAEQLRTADKELTKTKEKCDLAVCKGAAKDRLILELREGSKVLEDQLRLMDEKYLELRTKLDWARDLGSKKVKKAERVAADLRMKFALSGNSTLLDNIPLPDIYSSQYSSAGGSQLNGGNSVTFDDGNSWVSGGPSMTLNPKPVLGKGGHGAGRHQLSKSTTSLGKLQGGGSMASSDSYKKAPDIDSVLEKIRTQQGGKQEWTEEKLKKLTVSR